MSKLQLVWLEAEDEVFRTRFALHIYCFICINEYIATPVVEARACNLWDLGSSPSGILFSFFHIFLTLFVFFGRRWAPLGLAYFFCLFLLTNLPVSSWHPLAQVIYLFHLSFLKYIFSKY